MTQGCWSLNGSKSSGARHIFVQLNFCLVLIQFFLSLPLSCPCGMGILFCDLISLWFAIFYYTSAHG